MERIEVGRNHYPECPEIMCKIGNQSINMLNDSGSQVTYINAQFLNKNFKCKDWPKLPISTGSHWF